MIAIPDLAHLRKSAPMPWVALLVSVVLAAGPIFTCCRLNQGFSETLERAMKRIGAWVNLAENPEPPPVAVARGGCHGHAPAVASRPAPPDRAPAESVLKGHEACLSESALLPAALQPVSAFPSFLFVPAASPVPDGLAPRLVRIDKPRPQNKSSPPVYLLTLRLLV